MANFLRRFNTHAEYTAFTESTEYVTPNVSTCIDEDDVHYNPYVDYSKNYFTTVAKENGTIIFNGSTTSNTLRYSKDNGTTWSDQSQTPKVTVNAGDKVLWKGECTPNSSAGIGKFTSTATFDVEGNVMSLLYGDNFKGQTSLNWYAFQGLFLGNTKVISAENLSLPATTLAQSCYSSMFWGCTSLTTAPELPATTLAQNCYASMFYGCSSLKTAPALPANTLAYHCYEFMFYACTSLTTAPALPATELYTNCYQDMFRDCTSLTTAPQLSATTLANYCYSEMFYGCTSLTTAPELPAMTLVYSCYSSMFYGCTSLTTAPVLSATTLVNSCYNQMFSGCTRLNSITCLATDISAPYCTTNWVNGVAASGTFTKPASMSSWTRGKNGIPSGWGVQDA